jgi:ABC-type nitrate/sulfonate/bicarbonate transport system substrate-binding protein
MVSITYYYGHTVGEKRHIKGGSLKKYSFVTRGIMGAVISAALALPVSSVAHAADPVSVPMVTSPSLGSMPVFVAIAQQFDTDNGIKFTENLFLTGPTIQAALVAGTVKFTSADTNNWIPWSAATGAGIGGYTAIRQVNSAPFFDIVLRKGFLAEKTAGKTDFATVMAALKGSNIGIVAKGGASEFVWTQLVQGSGITWTGAVVGAPSAALIEAGFTSKNIDAAISYDPLLTQLVNKGAAETAFSIRENDKGVPAVTQVPGLLLGARSDLFATAEGRDLAKRVDKTYDAAITWMRNPRNFPALVELTQTRLSLSNADAIAAWKQNLNYYSTVGAINKAAIDAAGVWYAANQSALVKGKTYSSADLVFDVSAREVKALKVGQTVTGVALAKFLGLAPKRLSKITLTTTTAKNCKVSTSSVTMTKAGSCSVLVSVKDAVDIQTASRYARTFITVKK